MILFLFFFFPFLSKANELFALNGKTPAQCSVSPHHTIPFGNVYTVTLPLPPSPYTFKCRCCKFIFLAPNRLPRTRAVCTCFFSPSLYYMATTPIRGLNRFTAVLIINPVFVVRKTLKTMREKRDCRDVFVPVSHNVLVS